MNNDGAVEEHINVQSQSLFALAPYITTNDIGKTDNCMKIILGKTGNMHLCLVVKSDNLWYDIIG